MSKNKSYEVDNVAKVVKAVIVKLTDEDQKVVDRFRHNGYEVIGVDKLEKKESIYTQAKVVAYLESLQDKKHLEKYWEIYNEQAKDSKTKKPLVYLEDTKNGKHKKGDKKLKGHVGTLNWFKTTFPDFAK